MDWYVIYTKPRTEKKTAELLSQRNIEVYCPIQKQLRQWSDRKKWVEMVVIPSYVFVRCTEKERPFILQQPGVMNFVYWLGKPAVVRENEIVALQHFLDRHHEDKIELEEISPGMKIRIEGGPLHNKEGVVLNVNNKKARIELSGLGIALVASVHRSQIKQKGDSDQ
jgi:transcription antitermination factor NusG